MRWTALRWARNNLLLLNICPQSGHLFFSCCSLDPLLTECSSCQDTKVHSTLFIKLFKRKPVITTHQVVVSKLLHVFETLATLITQTGTLITVSVDVKLEQFFLPRSVPTQMTT